MSPADLQAMALFRPTWVQKLKSWPASWWHRGIFSNVSQFVLFIGYPRTGHSLIGSMLNAHKHGIIAHELNILHYVRRNFTRDQLCYLVWQQDRAFESIGRNWTNYNYVVEGQWQGRWEQIRFLGDKHGNGASHALSRHPHLVDQLQDRLQIPVRLVHVVRHPLDTIATMARKNVQGHSLSTCVDVYLDLCATNRRLLEKYADSVVTVHTEDLIANPRFVFSRLTKFLQLERYPTYQSACCSLVRSHESRTRTQVEWTPSLLHRLAKAQQQCSFLQRYDLSLQEADYYLSAA